LISYFIESNDLFPRCRDQLKYDGTRAETRICLRAKRTSPFKSARGGVSSVDCCAAEVCASAVVMLDTPCSELVWRVLATHCIQQFPLLFPNPCVTVCRHISTGLYNGRIWSSDYSTLFIAEVANAWIYTSTLTVMSYLINYKANFYLKTYKLTLKARLHGPPRLINAVESTKLNSAVERYCSHSSTKMNEAVYLKMAANELVPGRCCCDMWLFHPLKPNDHYSGRTAPLTSKLCILYIYSTYIGTEYFKHCIYSPFFLFKMQFVS